MKELLLGNEAIARGAWEAGVRVTAAYPGTPSTEITEAMALLPDTFVEWAPNEKVALEVGLGAAFGGGRSLVCMKHVGLNVAADPLFTGSYTGVRAGLVVVVADDPGMHSSQNEQDSRYYARAASLPMLEPADSAECYEYVKRAFDISEKFDTPVLVRITTRVAHSRGLVETGERVLPELPPYEKDFRKYVMMPGMARERHKVVEARMLQLQDYAFNADINVVEWRGTELGLVTSGQAYQYCREAFPDASVYKLGMVHPLNMDSLEDFSAQVDRLVVVEELEPIIEEQLNANGIDCEGRIYFGIQGELSAAQVKMALSDPRADLEIILDDPVKPTGGEDTSVVARPPVLCPGCPHRASFHVLSKLKTVVTGDIGCYTLGTLAPLSSMDTCVCMGASIGTAMGMEKARGTAFARNLVAVIGDSTFLHSGITGLIDMVYNGGTFTLCILDNATTGMTGHQPHAATGVNVRKQPAPQLSIEALVRAIGVEPRIVDPFDMAGFEAIMKEEMAKEAPSVVIVRRPCALLERAKTQPCSVEGCKKCKACMKIGCPALSFGENGAVIDKALCTGCGLCMQLCRFDAIGKEKTQ